MIEREWREASDMCQRDGNPGGDPRGSRAAALLGARRRHPLTVSASTNRRS